MTIPSFQEYPIENSSISLLLVLILTIVLLSNKDESNWSVYCLVLYFTSIVFFMCSRPGSNRPPRTWQARALPHELLLHGEGLVIYPIKGTPPDPVVHQVRFELTTYSLEVSRSNPIRSYWCIWEALLPTNVLSGSLRMRTPDLSTSPLWRD